MLNPPPDDWLQFSRTYDAWRYSPLKQINKKNVAQLHIAWVKGLPAGTTETIPLVHDGIIYTIAPGSDVMAIDGTNGDVIWEYHRTYKNPQLGSTERTKSLAIYKDMIYYTAPDGYVVALDATTGKVRWETFKTDTQNTSGAIVVEGKVISGGTCGKGRESCFIEADDADTGQKLWRFYNVAGPDDPGYASWNGADNTNLHGVHVGDARKLRSCPQGDLLGHRESVAVRTAGAARRKSGRRFAHGAGRPLQQLHRRARSRNRQAELVLPAFAGRRLGYRSHARTHAADHHLQSRSEGREVVQHRSPARIEARYRRDGR